MKYNHLDSKKQGDCIMIFPVRRVKEELINEFAVSNMDIESFCEMHNIQPDALKSWIDEKMHPTPSKGEIFSTTDFVEVDIPKVSKQSITISKNRKEFITVRTGGIEIDVPIETYLRFFRRRQVYEIRFFTHKNNYQTGYNKHAGFKRTAA